MNLMTLTLNPAFDLYCRVPAFAPYHENLARFVAKDAGGKGINLSRALTANNVPNTALVVLGEENAPDFCRALAADGLTLRTLTVAGRIRENITILSDGAPETRVSFPGFSADAALLDRVEREVLSLSNGETVLTVTGRLPDGMTSADILPMLSRFSAHGVRLVIDSKSFSPDDLRALRPWLIKPNEEELTAYLGHAIGSRANVRDAAKTFCDAGIEYALVSLGADGAMLVCREGVFCATPPKISVASTVGAGDSMIAGFLAAKTRGASSADALRTAVAYGTAACLREGTRPPLPADIAALMPQIYVQQEE